MEDIHEAWERERAIVSRVRAAIGAAQPSSMRAVLGFDGFIDEISHVVDKRSDAENFTRVETINAFAGRLASAAGKSANIEVVTNLVKIGGNGPIMANALSTIGMDTTYVGCLGYPALDPVFAELARKCRVFSIAPPAHTDALEFKDGKILLGKMTSLKEISWGRINSSVGADVFATMLDTCDLLALVNWTMIPQMTDIWERIIRDVLPQLSPDKRRVAFFDLADPEKRTRQDISRMLASLPRFSSRFEVTLGLNERESRQIARVLGMPEHALESKFINEICEFIADELDIHCVVVHPVKYAVATVRSGGTRTSFHQDGPNSTMPMISTGAGDHFNAGFAFGQLLNLGADASLLMGVCCSGYYVFTGATPGAAELLSFMETWRERMETPGV